MTIKELSQYIKAEALSLGFSACGIAKAEPVDENVAHAYKLWLAEGKNADMAYLENNLEKRLDPTILMPEAKSIICFALNYYPEKKLDNDQYQFAYYAYGKDYHDVIKAKLLELTNLLRDAQPTLFTKVTTDINTAIQTPYSSFKICVDTVPMLDRYWAWKAGLGWIGKNTNLIIPHAGSFFFLAEIIVDFELEYDSPMAEHCGTCTKCLEACPTGALCAPHNIDAKRCLSYLTIEHRGDLPVTSYQVPFESKDNNNTSFKNNSSQSQVSGSLSKDNSSLLQTNSSLTKDNDSPSQTNNSLSKDSNSQAITHNSQYIYGCDRCQLACPYNRFAVPTKIKEFTPSDEFLSMRPSDWTSLTIEQYRTLFKGSAVKRAKYEGLVRNIHYLQDVIHTKTSR